MADNERLNPCPEDDKIGSVVSSLITPIYRIINKIAPKSFTFSSLFWSLLSILILLALIKYKIIFPTIDEAISIFIILLILEFISYNVEEIKKLFKSRNEEKIKSFLDNLESQDLKSIQYFLDTSTLDTNEIKKLMGTKYKTNIDLHRQIIKTQAFNCDLIDHLATTSILEKLPDSIISKYVLWCPTCLNEEALKFFNKKSEPKTRGSLVLTQPMLFKPEGIVQYILFPFSILFSWITTVINRNNRNFNLLVLAFSLTIIILQVEKKPQDVTNFFVNFLIVFIFYEIFVWVYLGTIVPLWGYIYRKNSILL